MVKGEAPPNPALGERLPAKFLVKFDPAGAFPAVTDNQASLILQFFEKFHALGMLIMVDDVTIVKVVSDVHGVRQFKHFGRDLVGKKFHEGKALFGLVNSFFDMLGKNEALIKDEAQMFGRVFSGNRDIVEG